MGGEDLVGEDLVGEDLVGEEGDGVDMGATGLSGFKMTEITKPVDRSNRNTAHIFIVIES